jgi:hypothetical protein
MDEFDVHPVPKKAEQKIEGHDARDPQVGPADALLVFHCCTTQP